MNKFFTTDIDAWIENPHKQAILGADNISERANIPTALLERLVDLRLLRGVPLHYLIPHEDLLPPESMRFFFVDPTWTDRLIDGFLAAGDLGTKDQALRERHVHNIRKRLDDALNMGSAPLTGLLLRSQVVRRWPGMTVRAYAKDEGGDEHKLVTKRLARLAPGVLIALFAGLPSRVDLEEPGDGVRFGVEKEGEDQEGEDQDTRYTLQIRQEPTATSPTAVLTVESVKVTVNPNRTLDLGGLVGDLKQKLKVNDTFGSARLSLQLQQSPYCQICDVTAYAPEAVLTRMSAQAQVEVNTYAPVYEKLSKVP